jgi:hypothetical protein
MGELMTQHKVPRNNDVDLVFDGELLADVTSEETGKKHWTEIRIYRTESGKFVTEMIGVTTVEGQYDRVNVNWYENPADVRKGLLRPRDGQTGEFYLTVLAEEAIQQAAKRYPELSAALEERI